MKIFIIHRGSDYTYSLFLKKILQFETNSDVLILDNQNKLNIFQNLIFRLFKNAWKNEAYSKIKKSQISLVLLGKDNANKNMNWEIKKAKKLNKQICCIDISNFYNYEKLIDTYVSDINEINSNKQIINRIIDDNHCDKIKTERLPVSLYVKNKYTGDLILDSGVRIIRNIKELINIINDYNNGEYHIIKDKNNYSKEELFKQYQLYLATSDAVINRRQSISNFYITVNASLITILSVITSFIENISVKILVLIIISVVGIVLDLSWMKILDGYCILNQSKMKVITSIEKYLPVSLYEKEWAVMSDKLNSQKYVSFTESEKNIPKIFNIIFIIIFVSSVFAFILVNFKISFLNLLS